MRKLGIVLILLFVTGCGSSNSFVQIRIRPVVAARVAKNVAREIVHGVLRTVGRVVDVILR